MFTVETKILKRMLQVAKNGTTTKSIIPVTSYVKISTILDQLHLESNDLSTQGYIVKGETADIDQEAAICIPEATLTSLLQSWDEENVVVEYKEKACSAIFTNSKGRSEIKGIDADEFLSPLADALEQNEIYSITVDTNELKGAIGRVAFCSNPSEKARMFITAIGFKLENDLLVLMATDSYKAATDAVDIEENNVPDHLIDLAIPSTVILNIIRSIELVGGETIKISTHIPADSTKQSRMIFESGDMMASAQSMAFDFPDIRQFMALDPSYTFMIDIQEFLSMMNRAQAISLTSGFAKIVTTFNPEKSEWRIRTKSEETGNFDEVIEVAIIKTDALTIDVDYNSQYFSQALKSISTDIDDLEQAEFWIVGAAKPFYMKLKEAPNWTFVAMPVVDAG